MRHSVFRRRRTHRLRQLPQGTVKQRRNPLAGRRAPLQAPDSARVVAGLSRQRGRGGIRVARQPLGLLQALPQRRDLAEQHLGVGHACFPVLRGCPGFCPGRSTDAHLLSSEQQVRDFNARAHGKGASAGYAVPCGAGRMAKQVDATDAKHPATVVRSMNDDPIRVLVIDDEQAHAEAVAESLERVGYQCVIATSGSAGARKIETEDFDVVLTDLRMEDMDGLAILRKAKQELPDSEVVVITGYGDVRTAVEAIKQGAANYLTKPVDLVELRAIVEKAAERLLLARANRELKRQLDEKFGFEGVVGNSPKMHDVLSKLKSIAPTSATVLIQGETGTGKELVARALHY